MAQTICEPSDPSLKVFSHLLGAIAGVRQFGFRLQRELRWAKISIKGSSEISQVELQKES